MSSWLSPLVYDLAHCLCTPLTTLAFSMRFTGGRHIPPRGPALIIANHESFLDPVFVGVASPRRLRYLARKTIFGTPGFTWLIRTLGAVPVDQEGVAKEGLKAVLDLLRDGQAVLIFPEGGRCHDGQMQPLMPGIQLLIRRSLAPVVPVGIAGAFEVLPRARPWPHFSPLFLPPGAATVGVAIGAPIAAAPLAELSREKLLERLLEELKKVIGEAEKVRRKGPQPARRSDR